MNHGSTEPADPRLRQITPTDVAQFIRLEQCERYLRLRLQTRAQGDRFLRDQGIQPESIPPLLTRSGGQFEQRIESDARRRLPLLNLATDLPRDQRPFSDNDLVAEKARALGPGAELLLLQPRLEATVGEWRLRGDIDLLLLRRDEAGALHILIADMKSSTSAKMEHRLQVAFYHRMLGAVLAAAEVPLDSLTLGILYRGAADDRVDLTAEERAARYEQRRLAQHYFGTSAGLLELIADHEQYLQAVADLVTGPTSTAARVADAPLEQATFHLTYKCDGCLFNQFCMKWSAEHDDLSLLPHLAAQEKTALRRAGVPSMSGLAILKDLAPAAEGAPYKGNNQIGHVMKGDRLAVIEVQSNWARVTTPNGLTGWVDTAYLDYTMPASQTDGSATGADRSTGASMVRVTASVLNVRARPDGHAPVLTVLFQGEKVRVLGRHKSWTQVMLRNGGTGWASSTWLASA